MAKQFTTIQRRHSDKWLARITTIRAYTLENYFKGDLCGVDTLRRCLDNGDNLQINADKTGGRLSRHSNCWYEFEIAHDPH